MTTEGDGNYGLQKFLEAEGAECDIQPVAAWILFMIWEQTWDTQQRMVLLRRRELGDDRVYLYEVTFAGGSRWVQVGLAPDDRVSSFAVFSRP